MNKCKLFTVCAYQVKSPYTKHAASGLPNPINVDGYHACPGSEQQVTMHCPRIVTACSIFRSILFRCMYMYMCNINVRLPIKPCLSYTHKHFRDSYMLCTTNIVSD